MNEFSPSELIYLYIDGEADAGQQAALFAALAHDSDLQAEFKDALAMRMSVSTEVRNTVPAPALKNALFQKAGFSAGAAGVAASQTVVQNSGAATGWISGIKSLLPAISSLAGVAALVTGAVVWYNSSGVSQHEADNRQNVASHIPAPVDEHTSGKDAAPLQADISAPAKDDVSQRINRAERIPVASTRETAKESVHENGQKVSATNDDNSVEPTQSQTTAHSTHITRAAVFAPEQHMGISTDQAMETVEGIGDVPSLFIDSGTSFEWSISARGIIGLRLFPTREMGDAADLLDNTAIGAAWIINDEHSAGIEVGREVLPMYVADQGELQKSETLLWGGVLYRYTPAVVEVNDVLQPYASAFAGGSVSGPVLKSAVGLVWKPDTRIQFSICAEGTFLLYRYMQQWYGTQKLGVSYGASFIFP